MLQLSNENAETQYLMQKDSRLIIVLVQVRVVKVYVAAVDAV
jgi:hypothetical protein